MEEKKVFEFVFEFVNLNNLDNADDDIEFGLTYKFIDDIEAIIWVGAFIKEFKNAHEGYVLRYAHMCDRKHLTCDLTLYHV